MKLADDVRKFLIERQENPARPPVAGPDSRDPNPSEERKQAIKLWQEYAQATTDEYNRLYRNKMLGIVAEYRSKGVPVGFLDKDFEQHEPYLFMNGVVGQGDWGDDLAQFKNLSYRGDGYDNLINIDY